MLIDICHNNFGCTAYSERSPTYNIQLPIFTNDNDNNINNNDTNVICFLHSYNVPSTICKCLMYIMLTNTQNNPIM